MLSLLPERENESSGGDGSDPAQDGIIIEDSSVIPDQKTLNEEQANRSNNDILQIAKHNSHLNTSIGIARRNANCDDCSSDYDFLADSSFRRNEENN